MPNELSRSSGIETILEGLAVIHRLPPIVHSTLALVRTDTSVGRRESPEGRRLRVGLVSVTERASPGGAR